MTPLAPTENIETFATIYRHVAEACLPLLLRPPASIKALPGTQTPAKRPASPNQLVEEKSSSAASSSRRQSKRRTLFAPHPPAPIAVKEWAIKAEPGDTSGDAALAASFATVEPSARYSLRRRIKAEDTLPDATASSSSSVSTPRASRTSRRSTAAESDADDEGLRDNSVSPRKGNGKGKEKAKAITTSEPLSPFSISPRKTSQKPIKLSLEPHEAHPAPEKWRETYEVLKKQRARIVAPVDTMGCEATSAKDEREETRQESLEEKEKRKRFTTLISLMLSSQVSETTRSGGRSFNSQVLKRAALSLFCTSSDQRPSDGRSGAATSNALAWRIEPRKPSRVYGRAGPGMHCQSWVLAPQDWVSPMRLPCV